MKNLCKFSAAYLRRTETTSYAADEVRQMLSGFDRKSEENKQTSNLPRTVFVTQKITGTAEIV